VKGISTVFFDFGGTLVETRGTLEEKWREVSRRVGLKVEINVLVQVHEEADRRFRAQLYDYHGRMNEFWRLFNAFILERVGIEDSSGDLARAIDRSFKAVLLSRPYPETHGVLAALKSEGYKLGVISDATKDLIERLLAVGLSPYFDTVTYSQEARAEKPSPAIFGLALRKAACAPHEAVHVGDKMEADVEGARSAGIVPMLVDRQDRVRDADCLRVRDLRGILSLLHEP
jgi:putative hydrolase of the HAD superfamily